MTDARVLKPTPWDRAAFGIETYELTACTRAALEQAGDVPGHITVRLRPEDDRGLLQEFGYYYADTLLEPWCPRERFVRREDRRAGVTTGFDIEALAAMCRGAFTHGRFHRDPHLHREDADRRYETWLRQLAAAGTVWALTYDDEVTGFFAWSGSCIVLGAADARFRGRGLAKDTWSAACARLFDDGHDELTSSVSATNLAIVNLFVSLGFRFRRALDVYHRWQPGPAHQDRG